MASLTALIASEASLVQEAALAVPHAFDICTHAQGPIRQPVHLCLTCAAPRGVCSACSVACHGHHEQIELFPKRAFTCDCPTRIGSTACALHRGGVLPATADNAYGQNFEGKFCRCHRAYDAARERETMVQCVVCEDWYHESCLNLRTRARERGAVPEEGEGEGGEGEGPDGGEGDSNASNDLPSPLLPSSTYETLICGSCVLGNDTLRRWAGTAGMMMVVRREGDGDPPSVEDGGVDPRWKVLNGDDGDLPVDVAEGAGKRACEEGGEEERAAKKPRTEDAPAVPAVPPTLEPCAPCLAPPANPTAQHLLSRLHEGGSASGGAPVGTGDVFLTEGWRERWCRCAKCLPPLQTHAYLLDEEETYEPPEDPDSGVSLEELGMRALLNLPRDRAIDGIRAYNAMRDELMTYLRPFAQEGRVVREEDVRGFFEAKTQAARG